MLDTRASAHAICDKTELLIARRGVRVGLCHLPFPRPRQRYFVPWLVVFLLAAKLAGGKQVLARRVPLSQRGLAADGMIARDHDPRHDRRSHLFRDCIRVRLCLRDNPRSCACSALRNAGGGTRRTPAYRHGILADVPTADQMVLSPPMRSTPANDGRGGIRHPHACGGRLVGGRIPATRIRVRRRVGNVARRTRIGGAGRVRFFSFDPE